LKKKIKDNKGLVLKKEKDSEKEISEYHNRNARFDLITRSLYSQTRFRDEFDQTKPKTNQ
jgi:hypothetical protein